jgi:tRNA pseudouridine32 synthase/23S rRNA pseudouridine746 synthase
MSSCGLDTDQGIFPQFDVKFDGKERLSIILLGEFFTGPQPESSYNCELQAMVSMPTCIHPLRCDSLIGLEEYLFDPYALVMHPACLMAVKDLQQFLENQESIAHNFGFDSHSEKPIGKMFGVLVASDSEGKLGYIAAFSGKLAGSNVHPGFVPPIFDSLTKDGFLALGMDELGQLTSQIQATEDVREKQALKTRRASISGSLQSQLFDQYYFSNSMGEKKGLRQIFNEELGKNPPTAAGECAAPKLLQYAFDNDLKPIALAEFWWGASTRSPDMKHGHFYPPCEDKCRPILKHMLS